MPPHFAGYVITVLAGIAFGCYIASLRRQLREARLKAIARQIDNCFDFIHDEPGRYDGQ